MSVVDDITCLIVAARLLNEREASQLKVFSLTSYSASKEGD